MFGLLCIIKALLGGLMAKFVNRKGQKFGRLTVLFRNGTNHYKKVMWRCLCECGKETDVVAGALVTGNTTSCGCVVPNFKHGGWKKSSYNTWRAMMRRCYNPNDKDYPRYGGAGVLVHQDWHDYLHFANDMGEPSGSETLDRIDPYGNYEPKNCRWAALPVQARNTRMHSKNKSGYTGVTEVYSGRWMAKITKGQRSFYSKVFYTIEEAVTARKELERLHWGVA